MTIDVQCPECRKAYRIDDEKAGLRMICNSCDTVVTVPDFETIDDEDLDDDADAAADSETRSSFISPLQVAIGGILLAATTGAVLTLLHQYGLVGPENVNYVQQVFAKADAPSENPEADEKAKAITAEYIKLMNTFADTIESVNDVESAKAAAVKINKLADQLEELKQKLKSATDPSKSVQRKLNRDFEAQMKLVGDRLMKASPQAATNSKQDKSYIEAINRIRKIAQSPLRGNQ